MAGPPGSAAGVWTVVVAAGSGSRFGGPKQFAFLGGERVIDRAVRVAVRRSEGVVVVVAADHAASVAGLGEAPSGTAAGVSVVSGGVTRSESVRRGIESLPDEAEVVLVHDGARPLADGALYRRVAAAVRRGADVAVPALDVVDTVRWRSGGAADRDALVAVQTPQGFRAEVLRAAHSTGADASDDASLAEMLGYNVVLVAGDRRNLKITEPADIRIAEALLAAKPGPHPSRAGGGGGEREGRLDEGWG